MSELPNWVNEFVRRLNEDSGFRERFAFRPEEALKEVGFCDVNKAKAARMRDCFTASLLDKCAGDLCYFPYWPQDPPPGS